VGNILDRLARVELICGGVLLLMLIAQPFLIDLRGQNLTAAILRSVMFLAAVALVVYDWRVVWPKIQRHRAEYIEHADEPELANPAKDQFDRYHRQSVTVMMFVLFLLLGMILFSANITPRGHGTVGTVGSEVVGVG
jgi:hypothetical protein